MLRCIIRPDLCANKFRYHVRSVRLRLAWWSALKPIYFVDFSTSLFWWFEEWNQLIGRIRFGHTKPRGNAKNRYARIFRRFLMRFVPRPDCPAYIYIYFWSFWMTLNFCSKYFDFQLTESNAKPRKTNQLKRAFSLLLILFKIGRSQALYLKLVVDT